MVNVDPYIAYIRIRHGIGRFGSIFGLWDDRDVTGMAVSIVLGLFPVAGDFVSWKMLI